MQIQASQTVVVTTSTPGHSVHVTTMVVESREADPDLAGVDGDWFEDDEDLKLAGNLNFERATLDSLKGERRQRETAAKKAFVSARCANSAIGSSRSREVDV